MKAIRVTSTNHWMIAMLAEKYSTEEEALPLKWWQSKFRYVVTIPVRDWNEREGTAVQLSVLRLAQQASYFVADFTMEFFKAEELTPVN